MGNSKARGCGGERQKGGIYLETNGSEDGIPLENFFLDPPFKVSLDELGISAIGTHLVEKDGVWHIMDVIGSKHYENVADFVEEGRVLGFSRRSSLRSAADFAKLTKDSRQYFIHRRGYIENFEAFAKYPLAQAGLNCPKGIHKLGAELKEMCACLYYADVQGDVDMIAFYQEGVEGSKSLQETLDRAKNVPSVEIADRKLPCGLDYKIYRPHDFAVDTQYHYAVFLSLPISRIVLVDPNGEHQDKLGLLKNAKLSVEVLDE